MSLWGSQATAEQYLLSHALGYTEFGNAEPAGSLVSFFRNALESLLFFSPPGVCLRSPDHTSKHVAGVLATEAASSILPYCCSHLPETESTLPIQSATGTELLAAFLLKATSASNEE